VLVCWEAFPSTPYILNATGQRLSEIRSTETSCGCTKWFQVRLRTPWSRPYRLTQVHAGLSRQRRTWEFIKDLESRHRGEMWELRGEWVEEPTTSCPTKKANPEMFHAQYALSQKEVRGLVLARACRRSHGERAFQIERGGSRTAGSDSVWCMDWRTCSNNSGSWIAVKHLQAPEPASALAPTAASAFSAEATAADATEPVPASTAPERARLSSNSEDDPGLGLSTYTEQLDYMK
jgi:hypothetical protein